MKISNMNSGKALRQLMAKNGTSRIDMAIVLGCTETTVTALRNSKGIATGKLEMVCDFFHVSASDYFKLGES